MISTLGGVAEVRMGFPFRSRLEHDPEGHVMVIQMRDIDDANLLHVADAARVDLPDLKEQHRIQKGDLLFRSRGRSYTSALVSQDIGLAVLAAPMFLIRPKSILPAYLHWYMNLPETQMELGAMARGTAVQMVGKDALGILPVPVPSMKHQQQIAEIAAMAQREHSLMSDIAARRKQLTERILTQYARNAS